MLRLTDPALARSIHKVLPEDHANVIVLEAGLPAEVETFPKCDILDFGGWVDTGAAIAGTA
jgi:hypothetical protein